MSNSFPTDLRKHFTKFLDSEFNLRPSRTDLPDSKDEYDFITSGIVHMERESILNEMNRLRNFKSLPPVTLKQVSTADTLATGHIDFASKLCFILVN